MLKLHAGISRKVGLPGFSSASASCHIEAELDSSLLNDIEGFQIVVQRAYQSCERAVDAQVTRLQHVTDARAPRDIIALSESPTYRSGRNTDQAGNRPNPRPATASQVKAIRAICARRRIDLLHVLRERYGLTRADELGIRQASDLIDELKNDDEAMFMPSAFSEADAAARPSGKQALAAGGAR